MGMLIHRGCDMLAEVRTGGLPTRAIPWARHVTPDLSTLQACALSPGFTAPCQSPLFAGAASPPTLLRRACSRVPEIAVAVLGRIRVSNHAAHRLLGQVHFEVRRHSGAALVHRLHLLERRDCPSSERGHRPAPRQPRRQPPHWTRGCTRTGRRAAVSTEGHILGAVCLYGWPAVQK